MKEIKPIKKSCASCEYRTYEHDLKTYVCDDPDGEYFGEPVREREHCPDWMNKNENWID